MIPTRSEGANPVRQASASWGEVSQLTEVIATPPRSWASTSPISRYRVRARPSNPPPDSLACLAMRVSGTTIVTNASVRTDAWLRPRARSSLIWVASAGAPARRCRWTHRSRSAPSSGTVRTVRRTSSISSVRAARSSRSVSPCPRRARSSDSAIPMPGCTIAAVSAQVLVAWFWITATRASAGPCGGPSWIWTPCSTPGRSATAMSSAAPAAAREPKLVHPISPPRA